MGHSSLLRKSAISVLLMCLIILSLAPACTRPSVSPGPEGTAASSPQVATIVIAPVSVEQGKKFSVTGAGFEPNGLVTLTMAGVPLDLGKIYKEDVKGKLTAGEEFTFEFVETNGSGAFVKAVAASATLGALAILEPGVYTVRAQDSKGTSATYPLELVKKKA